MKAASLRRLRAALALFGLAAVAALGLELALRAARGGGARIWQPYLEAVFEPDPRALPGVDGPARFAIGALGVRARELETADERAVLALGGSTTECLVLDQQEAWPALLERALAARSGRPTWVGNGGRSGLHMEDHVLQLRHLEPPLSEVELVLLLVGVNDLALALSSRDPSAQGEDARLARAFQVPPLGRERGPLWRRTATWRWLRELRHRLLPTSAGGEAMAERYERWRANRRAAPRLLTDLPELEPALARFEALLREALAAIRAHGARPVLLTQPALWDAALSAEHEARLWMGWAGDSQEERGAPYYGAAALRAGLERYNERLRAVGRAEGALVVELAAPLSGRAELFYDDVHFTEAGAREVARLVDEALAAAGLGG